MHLLDNITHHFKNEVASLKNFFWVLTKSHYNNSYKFPSAHNKRTMF